MAAPTVAIYIPPSTATRMSPCAVQALIDTGQTDLPIAGLVSSWARPDEPGGVPDQSVSVQTDSDDADQVVGGALVVASNSISLRTINQRHGAMRFEFPSSLPNGKFITRAELVCDVTFNDNPASITIYGDAQLASPQFAAAPDDIDSRTRTTESATWVPGAGTGSKTASGLQDIIQAIYDLGERDVFTLILEPINSGFKSLFIGAADSPSTAPELRLWLADAPTKFEYELQSPISSFSLSGSAVSNFVIKENGTPMAAGTVGSLAQGEYALSGDTLYVRLSDDTDPSSKADDYLQISFDVSTTGDGSRWEQCRIMWQLEADGTALADWPDKYRYVTDPRPGLDSKQIDQAGQTDTSNFNRPRGFNYGWILTDGTWRVTATVTNVSRESASSTSGDITVAANTRTQYTVQASGGDYTTVSSALTALGATDDIELIVEDGHAETTGALPIVTGANFSMRAADGFSIQPRISFDDGGSGSRNASTISLRGENWYLDNIAFAEATGDVETGELGLTAVDIRKNGAAFQCDSPGEASPGNRNFMYLFINGNIENFVALKCTSDFTRGYSYICQSGLTFYGVTIAGCVFGPSTNESVIRHLQSTFTNVAWCHLENDGSKSALRFAQGRYHHSYGCRLLNGDNWTGSATDPGSSSRVYNVRSEASYASGQISAASLLPGITYDIQGVVACNSIAEDNLASIRGGNSSSEVAIPYTDIDLVHNSLIRPGGTGGAYFSAGTTGGDANFSACRWAANLCTHPDAETGLFNETALGNGRDAYLIENNILPTGNYIFCVPYNDGIADVAIEDFSLLNAEAFASGNVQYDASLDANYFDDGLSAVATESGVYDDYYGTSRSATSLPGAVAASPSSGPISSDTAVASVAKSVVGSVSGSVTG